MLVRIAIVILAVIGLHAVGWLRPVESGLRSVLNLGLAGAYRAASFVAGGRETATGPSNEENGQNREAERVELDLLRAENVELRALLSFSSSTHYALIGADVIGRGVDPLGTTIIINQGRRSGLRLNNPVVAGQGRLIGTVARVEETAAVVRLINDSRSRVAATVISGHKSLGLVEGGYGLSVKMNYIPQNEVIKPGDTVVTSGLEGTIPRGLLIGTVEVVEKKPQEPFQEAVLKTAFDLHNLSVVSVLLYEP